MTRIAFIGLGNMGGGMAANQAKAGHEVLAFDLAAAAVERAVAAGCRPAASAAEAVEGRRGGDHHAAGRAARPLGLRRTGPAQRAEARRC